MIVDVEKNEEKKTLAIVVMSQQDRLILCLSSHTGRGQKKTRKKKVTSQSSGVSCKAVERCAKIQALAPLWELDSFWLETAPETFACAPEHT